MTGCVYGSRDHVHRRALAHRTQRQATSKEKQDRHCTYHVSRITEACSCYHFCSGTSISTVIPRLTSDPANEDFFAVFRTRLTNVLVDARANIKQQT